MLINRFAHPFFTPKPVAERKAVPGVGKRMTDHIEGTPVARDLGPEVRPAAETEVIEDVYDE